MNQGVLFKWFSEVLHSLECKHTRQLMCVLGGGGGNAKGWSIQLIFRINTPPPHTATCTVTLEWMHHFQHCFDFPLFTPIPAIKCSTWTILWILKPGGETQGPTRQSSLQRWEMPQFYRKLCTLKKYIGVSLHYTSSAYVNTQCLLSGCLVAVVAIAKQPQKYYQLSGLGYF